jgi:hypothetical protein
MMAVVSAIATIIDVSDASAQSWGRRGAECSARTAVSCREMVLQSPKTHLPDRGTITAQGRYKLQPGMEADELNRGGSRFHQPN